MSRRPEEGSDKNNDPKSKVYDLLGELNESSIPFAKQLLVMGGQKGIAGAYFFEKDSSKYLHSTREVTVSNEEGEEVGRLNGSLVFDAFYVRPPEWLQKGRIYRVSEPQVTKEESDKLWDIRNGILKRLKNEGSKAAEEFYLIGTAMGGEEEDKDEVVKDIESRISRILQGVGKKK